MTFFTEILKLSCSCRLFAGCAPRVVWTTIGSALFFGTYDFTLRVLGNVREEIANEEEVEDNIESYIDEDIVDGIVVDLVDFCL